MKNKKIVGRSNKTIDYAMAEGWLSLVVNLLLFGFKYAAGTISGSIAIIADAWHTISDSLTSLVVLVGTRISRKPADREHPFGHGRAQFIASIIIGVFLAIVGFNIIVDSIGRLQEKEGFTMGWLAITAVSLSVVVKEAMARFAFWAGRKTNNPSVRSDGWHHRSDAITSLIVLVGLLAGTKLWWIDPVLGVLIAAFLFYTAFRIIRESANPLLGEEPDEVLIEMVKQLTKEVYPSDLRAHHFHLHNYGNHQEMTFHIVLPKDMQLMEAHEITGRLFSLIKKELNIVATIHIDTASKY